MGRYRQTIDRAPNTVIGPGGDVPYQDTGTTGLAVKTDCNARYVFLDPRVGGE